MDDQSQFVTLRCKVCGGKLAVPKQYTVDMGDGIFTIAGDNIFACQHCDTEYLPKQSLERFAMGGRVNISNNSGNITVGKIIAADVSGDVIGGDMVIGDKIVLVPPNDADSPSAVLKSALTQWQRGIESIIDGLSGVDDDEKEALKKNVGRLAKEAAQGQEANLGKIERWLNTIGAMAPHVLDITADTLKDPFEGVGLVIEKLGDRIKLEWRE